MKNDELESVFLGLINNLKGIDILDSVVSDNHIRIDFTVIDSESLLLLAYAGEAANAGLDNYVLYEPGSEKAKLDPQRAIAYRYCFNKGGIYSDVIDRLMWIGAHLNWIMYQTKVIDSKKEKKYSKAFGAASRSE